MTWPAYLNEYEKLVIRMDTPRSLKISACFCKNVFFVLYNIDVSAFLFAVAGL